MAIRMTRAAPLPPLAPGARYVLWPELLGAVVRFARESVAATQTEVAAELRVPQGTISRLERGEINMGVYHLDSIASILTNLGANEGENLDRVPAEGWQLYAVASRISDRLQADGNVVLWGTPQSIGNPNQYLRSGDLYGVVETLWPNDLPIWPP